MREHMENFHVHTYQQSKGAEIQASFKNPGIILQCTCRVYIQYGTDKGITRLRFDRALNTFIAILKCVHRHFEMRSSSLLP